MNKNNTLDTNLPTEMTNVSMDNIPVNSKHTKIPYILIVALILTNCITGFFAVRLYYLDKLNIFHIEQMQADIEQKEKDIADKDNNISELQSKLDKADAISSANYIIAKMEENEKRNSSADNSAETCNFPNCTTKTVLNKPYCINHACLEVSCYKPKANLFTQYCEDHKCKNQNCNSKAYEYGYCLLHSRY